MAQPVEAREQWRDVSRIEFDAFLRRYPRPLEARLYGTWGLGLLGAFRSVAHVLHELLEPGARLLGGHQLGFLNTGIALWYRLVNSQPTVDDVPTRLTWVVDSTERVGSPVR
jgi:hypothetical protein